uniref:Uncharacterized protein n=1 Tax=Proboscia inermis TaxID=420281 RepID=A0A7S0CLL0_9STRA
MIGFSHLMDTDDEDEVDVANKSRHTTGNLLILGQSVMSALQDIADEIFLQESHFPATLLLGMEGAYGLLISLGLYLLVTRVFHADDDLFSFSSDSIDSTQKQGWTTFLILYSMGLTIWFTITGTFNVWTTEATSSMTRNVWKNARTLFVWLIGLVIYYNTDRNDADSGKAIIGEEWESPESYIVLLGYVIMLGGAYVYYQ